MTLIFLLQLDSKTHKILKNKILHKEEKRKVCHVQELQDENEIKINCKLKKNK